MNPLLLARLRSNWTLVLAMTLLTGFLLVHWVVFGPTARRYQTAMQQASKAGLTIDPDRPPRLIPPRVLALLSENALSGQRVNDESSSGALTAQLLEDLTRLCSQNGMEVVGTEPGATVRQANAIQVRAHLRIQCTYGQFLSFLDTISRSNKLIAVDRFTLTGESDGRHGLELWITRFVLKQSRGTG